LAVVRPVTVSGLAVPVAVPVTPLLVEVHVTAKLVMALPLLAPAVNDTLSGPVDDEVEPGTAATAAGAAGDPTITAGDGADAMLAPFAFVAFTVQV
jgi:hypothetical protein